MLKAMAASNEPQQHRDMAHSKRHRRPNVRLGEIGDLPAALLTALYFSRKQEFDSSDEDVAQGDIGPNSAGPVASDAAVSEAMLAKTRRLLYVGTGNFHGQTAATNGYSRKKHNMSLDSLSSQYDFRLSSGAGVDEKPQLNSRTSFLKATNRKRRRGASRGLPPIEKLTRAIPSIIEIDENEKDNTSPVDNPMNKPYNSDTPEGLETLEGPQGAIEASNSQETRPLETSLTISGSPEFQHGNEFRHAISEDAIGADKDGPEAREGSANNQATPTCGTSSEHDRHTKLTPEAKGVPEANGKFEDREPPHVTAKDQQPGRVLLNVSLANGVRGWLNNLGLVKYCPLFEVHEVDTEVLPLLTLEDLKEMGIQAVGTRRKLFSAIQQLGKVVMA